MSKETIYLASFNGNAQLTQPAAIGQLRDVSLSSDEKEEFRQKLQSEELAWTFNRLDQVVHGFVQHQTSFAYRDMSAPTKSKTIKSVAGALVNQHIAASIPDVGAMSNADFDNEIMDYYDSAIHPLLSYGKDMLPKKSVPNYVFHAMMMVEYDLTIPDDAKTTGTEKAGKLAKRVHKFLNKNCKSNENLRDDVRLVAYSYLYNRLNQVLDDILRLTEAVYSMDDSDAYESLDEMVEHVAVMNDLSDTIGIKEGLHNATVHLNNISMNTGLGKKLHELSQKIITNIARLDGQDIVESAEIVELPTLDQ